MSEGIIFLTDVRLSFPHLTEPHKSAENAIPKYSADLLLNTDHQGFSQFMQIYGELALAKWAEHSQQVMAMIGQDRKLRCYGSGEEKVNKKTFQPYDGYVGQVYLTASRDTPPQMIKPDGSAVDPRNTMEYQQLARNMYGGCYINAAVKPWLQDNKHGRGVRLDLVAVQFNRDGEAFGEGETDVSGMFGAVASTPPAQPAGMGIPGMPTQEPAAAVPPTPPAGMGIPGMPTIPGMPQ